MTIDQQLIDSCKTPAGGWTRATLLALGITDTDSAKRGWQTRIIGTKITEQQYQQALAGRTVFVTKADRRHAKRIQGADSLFGGGQK